ncbi:hypothetical protein M434DRAFT_26681 [Hypoxylon sp. CO27-5]|nr:hypothetical protein M434DRAFT_26681 [Hypoxylon sp. CO27-5]
MGFWDSLIHGATEVGKWVGGHAGDILKAAETVAKVVTFGIERGLVQPAKKIHFDDDENILPKFFGDLGLAADVLAKYADQHYPASPTRTLNTINLEAFWPSPPTLEAPEVPPEISGDVNKLLVLNSIPAVVSNLDLGQVIAQQMFAQVTNKITTDDDDNVLHSDIDVRVGDRFRITGGLCYYKIPLGNPGGDNAWHSYLRLHNETSPETMREILLTEKRKLAIEKVQVHVSTSEPYNTTIITATWNGARGTSEYTTKAIQWLHDQYQGTIEYVPKPLIDGTNYTYRFRSGTDVGPGQILAAFSTALHKVVPKPTDDHPLPSLPTLQIDHVTTIVP